MTGLWRGWLTATLMTAPLAAGAQESGGYRVAGVVLNAAGGQPVADAHITIVAVERRDQQVSAVSGENGRFVFMGLPQGKYQLAGRGRGLLAGSWAGAIVTGPGRDTESIVLRLSPPGVISGKVVDDAGDPVAQALVELLGSRIVEGRRQLIEDSSKRTDDTGQYRFSALLAGSYYLVVSGVPWYTKFNETHGDSAPRGMTHAGYGVRYYPNVDNPAAAEPLILQAGQEATANFTLLPVPAASAYVHCEQAESLAKQYTLTAAGLPGNPAFVRQGSEAGELYNLWGILPGHYTLRTEATDGNHTWYDASEFDVAADDMDIEVTLRDAPSLSGTAVLDGGGSLPAQLTVVLGGEIGRNQALAMGAGGRFSTPAIPPGRYRVSIGGAEEYYLKNWSAEGARREGGILDIPPSAAVRLTLSVGRGAGRIAGTVYRDGQPLPGALVVLTPSNRAVRSNSDGSYELRGLPAGDYALFAVEDGADLEYADPAAIRPYLGSAKKVQVAPGASDNLRLDVGKTAAALPAKR
jgi:hypothetical protein